MNITAISVENLEEKGLDLLPNKMELKVRGNIESRLQKIDNIEYILEEVLQKDECFSLKDLAVNGKDLIEIGYKPGKEIGNTLNCLLQLVIEGVYLNEKSELLKYVETTKEWMKLGENYNGKII